MSGTADTSRTRYNTARQVIGSISPDPDGGGALKHRAVRNTYDSSTGLLTKTEQGNVNSQSDSDWAAFSAAQAAETVYDSNARPIVGKLTSGSTVYALGQTSYDALGRPECSAQRMNPAVFGSVTLTSACTLGTQGSGTGDYGPDRISKAFYDAAGRVYKTRTALGTSDEADESLLTFTPNGQIETATDGENNKTTYAYDGHDRLEKTYYPMPTKGAGSSNASDYEQSTYESLASGTRTSPLAASFRNRAGETTAFGYDALGRPVSKDRPGSEPDVAYGYDLLGRMTGASQTGNSLTFTYDALGRQLTETRSFGSYSSQYDIAGRRTRLTHPDGFYVDQDYLVTGEMVAIRENGAASGVGVLATFGYDDLGRRTSLTYGNGEVTSYQYDAMSRLSQLGLDLSGTTNDLTVTFGYNPASQIASNARSNDLYAWTGHGSGTTSTTTNGLNQLASWNATFAYDSKGNLTSDSTRTYSYDSGNQLTGLPGGSLFYDPLGRLSGAGVSSPAILYDTEGADMTAERNPSTGAVGRRHVFGPGTDEPLVWYEGSGTTDRRFLHSDEHGSIVAVTSSAGALLAINRYDENGKPETTNALYTARFLYTGQRYLSGPGIYYYKARMYDPRLGRFLQTDPIGYGAGMNMYGYVKGDPVNFTDPMGLKEECSAGQHWEQNPTGSRIPRCVANGGGIAGPLSPGSSLAFSGGTGGLAFAFYVSGNSGSVSSSGNTITVTASTPGSWISFGSPSNGSGAQLWMLQGGGGAVGSWATPEQAAQRWLEVSSAVLYRELTGKELPRGVVITPNGERLLNAIPVGSALKDDPYHRAATFVRAEAVFFARFQSLKGNDGQMYLHAFLPGTVNDQRGNFHYVIDGMGRLTHQSFER